MATPHYKDVPADWKHPLGPFKLAPAEFGGEWWLVNPFNSNSLTGMVWEKEGKPLASDPPADFAGVFGPRPARHEPFYVEWNDNLPASHGGRGYFKGVGLPEWLTKQEVDAVNETYRAWGMGDGVVYQGRYGWSMRWPGSKEYDFDWDARSAVMFPGAVVPVFQERLVAEGKKPAKWYPTVPPHIRGEDPK